MVKCGMFLILLVSLIINLGYGSITAPASINPPKKVLLSVFYESLCSDSTAFVRDQLLPASKYLEHYLNVDFIPFGKSNSKDYGNSGFDCQHGPEECNGNMVQNCALNLMKNWNMSERVKYVDCEMETKAGTANDWKCVKKAGLNESDVFSCITSAKGINLQLEAEFKTSQVNASFIPTIVLGGEFDPVFQDNALTNLTSALCDKLRYLPPCKEYFNTEALTTILTTTVNFTGSP